MRALGLSYVDSNSIIDVHLQYSRISHGWIERLDLYDSLYSTRSMKRIQS